MVEQPGTAVPRFLRRCATPGSRPAMEHVVLLHLIETICDLLDVTPSMSLARLHLRVHIELSWVVREFVERRPEGFAIRVVLPVGRPAAVLRGRARGDCHVHGWLQLGDLRHIDCLKAVHPTAWPTRLASSRPAELACCQGLVRGSVRHHQSVLLLFEG